MPLEPSLVLAASRGRVVEKTWHPLSDGPHGASADAHFARRGGDAHAGPRLRVPLGGQAACLDPRPLKASEAQGFPCL
jgi:hypothetical protein